jgi:hypothetical protein
MFSSNINLTSLSSLMVLTASLLAQPSAWAYKVEKICEDLPATSTAPAQKKCKVVRVQEGAAKAAAADGKGDGKGDGGHGEAKKDAKPAGGH